MKSIIVALALCVLCIHTAQAQNESLPVWRVQLKVTTCESTHAGTDDAVRCSLNSDQIPTVLDYPRNDFTKKSKFKYDLALGSMNKLSDIQHLKIFKSRTDGVCLKSMSLFVNEYLVYDTVFRGGRWLDDKRDSQSVTIDGATLRADPKWKTLDAEKLVESLMTIKSADIESIIKAQCGTLIMSRKDFTWGDSPSVKVTKRNENSLACSVKFSVIVKVKLLFWIDDVEVPYQENFTIITCKDQRPVFILEGAAKNFGLGGLNNFSKWVPVSGCYNINPNGDLSFEPAVATR